MLIEITLSPEVLKAVRKILQFLHLKSLLHWWREIESWHWRTRGLINGRSRYQGAPDFVFPPRRKEQDG